jgi:biotin-(acetyl-CoA carboxylase) ligase
MTESITFPPLMWGEAATGDAFDHACARATLGCDAGLMSFRNDTSQLQAALVLTPEVPLAKAMAMFPACALGFQNALGALAPPEVAVHLGWTGDIRINGARAGQFRMAAAGADDAPDWLIIGLTLDLLPQSDDPGENPHYTCLYSEGCADVDPAHLIEAYARHALHWITRWDDEGPAPLHREWRGLIPDMGEDVTVLGRSGTFLGLDEDFGLLLRDQDGTQLIPLTELLERSA